MSDYFHIGDLVQFKNLTYTDIFDDCIGSYALITKIDISCTPTIYYINFIIPVKSKYFRELIKSICTIDEALKKIN